MINRICGGENSSASKKKSRLEALAASRDRELGPDTDSEEELDKEASPGGKGGSKTKAARKLSRSVPSKSKKYFISSSRSVPSKSKKYFITSSRTVPSKSKKYGTSLAVAALFLPKVRNSSLAVAPLFLQK